MFVCLQCGRLEEQAGFCSDDGEKLSPRDDEMQGLALGNYRVTKLIGRGGMGQVYLGIHPGIGSRVAIKVLNHESLEYPELVQRFFDEARAVNFIRHENIVNVLDLAHLPDGRPYIIMEHLDGHTLRDVLQGKNTFFDAVARVLDEVLSALQAAHAKGIVHRDLKPDNIFVTPGGHAKVLDFGIAKLRPELTGQRAATRTGAVFGTPQYMSPEQALGLTVDARTDLYSFGVVLYEAISGRRPFEGNTMYELLQKHVTEVPAAPSSYRRGVPRELDQVVIKALAKDVAQRFGSAEELRSALREAMRQARLVEGGVGIAASAETPLSSGLEQARVPRLTPAGGGSGLGYGMAASAVPLAAARPSASPYTQPATTAAGFSELQAISNPYGGAAQLGGVGYGVQSEAGGYRIQQPHGGYASAQSGPGYPGSATTGPQLMSQAAFPARRRASKWPLLALLGCGGLGVAVALSLAGIVIWSERQVETTAELAQQAVAVDPGRAQEAQAAGERLVREAMRAAHGSGLAPAGSEIDFARFDIGAYLPKALAMAREEFSDAEFLRLDASGVKPDGTVNITSRLDNHVIYRFRSPSRSVPPVDYPKNLEYEGPCLFYVNVMSTGISTHVVDHWKCTEPVLSLPRCTPAQVWSKASQRGAATGNVVGQIGFWADKPGEGRWYLTVPPEYSGFLPDEC